ncbi:M-phase phosphoprotein 6 [Protopterus annectens]|uniref:M-phase phosphoprotein 6 n=1 Tax=Protopterus annectens TaxID=7888 RepID=UPI001CF96B4D|nr:M-phase phosphoprotein 6 [Protopterus annectens]
MASDIKMKLSKNVLRMKFMQRGLDDETRKQLEEEEKKIISDEHWYLDLPELKEKENFLIEEKSFVPCEDLVYGRMSFNGFNPEVEKLMLQFSTKIEKEEREDGKEEDSESDVSDEEMVWRYECLVGTIKQRIANKRAKSHSDSEDDDEEDWNFSANKLNKTFVKPKD